MAQAAVITAGDAVAAKAAPQPVTVTAADQGTSTGSQSPRCTQPETPAGPEATDAPAMPEVTPTKNHIVTETTVP